MFSGWNRKTENQKSYGDRFRTRPATDTGTDFTDFTDRADQRENLTREEMEKRQAAFMKQHAPQPTHS